MPKYGINKVILLGNVGSEPELRYLDQGVAVCSFRFATTERSKNRDGLQVDRTEWHNIVLWRQKAELAKKYFKVGTGLYIEGSITTRSWDGPDGQKRYKTEIEADSVRFLDGSPEVDAQASNNSAPQQQKSTEAGQSVPPANASEDEPPF